MKLLEVDGEVAKIWPDTGPLVCDEGVEARRDVSACTERQNIWRDMPTHLLVIYLPHRAFQGLEPIVDRLSDIMFSTIGALLAIEQKAAGRAH